MDGGTVKGWTGSTHFVVCADYKNEDGKDYVYIINPARNPTNPTGWYDISEKIDISGWVSMRIYYRK